MGADGLGDPLNDHLGFGGHQGLAHLGREGNVSGSSDKYLHYMLQYSPCGVS